MLGRLAHHSLPLVKVLATSTYYRQIVLNYTCENCIVFVPSDIPGFPKHYIRVVCADCSGNGHNVPQRQKADNCILLTAAHLQSHNERNWQSCHEEIHEEFDAAPSKRDSSFVNTACILNLRIGPECMDWYASEDGHEEGNEPAELKHHGAV